MNSEREAIWEALGQYIENGQEHREVCPEDAKAEALLSAAERVMARMNAELASLANQISITDNQ